MEIDAANKRRQMAFMGLEDERLFSGPMTEVEIRFLRDVQAYVEFAIRNGLGFARAMAVLQHDITQIVGYDGFDLQKSLAKGFWPKVSRYAEITSDSVGEPVEAAE